MNNKLVYRKKTQRKNINMKNNDIETDLIKIKHLASIKENENMRFRTFLKGQNDLEIDTIVHQLHEELIKYIDCTQCGNCCRDLELTLHSEDITVLAQMENSDSESYIANYCEKNTWGDISLKTPCRYLDGVKCNIYMRIVPKNVANFHIQTKKDLYSAY
jgi:hypothetical protein